MAAPPVSAQQRALATLDAVRDAEDPSLSAAGVAAVSTTGARGQLDMGAIATVFLDSNFHITGYTPAAASLLLLTPHSIGRSLEEAASPLRYAEVNADAGAVLERLVPIEREVGHEGGNWFLARLLPYQTLEERASGVVLTLVDITQRKRAEELSQWLSAVVASSMDAIVGFSLSGTVLSWNNGARQLFGYQASEMVGLSMERLVDEAHVDESRWILSQVREHKSVAGLNTVRRAKGGGALHVALTASPVADGAGQVVGGAVSVRDIGEARRTNEALRRSEERLRLVIENARDYAIFSTDLDRQVTSWNKGAERLLGFTEGDVMGHSADLIFTDEDRDANAPQQEALTALREQRAADERIHVRKDGSRFWASGMLMRMQDDAGHALGFVKILRDETESRASKAALERSQADLMHALEENQGACEALEAADAAKDQFITVLSHELRNPLASLLGAAALMLDPTVSEEENRQAAAIVQRQSLTMKALLDDLLDVSRLTVNRLHLRLRDVDLRSVVADAIETVRPMIVASGHRLQTELPSRAILVHVDPVRIGQVLVNLLGNAAKYTPAGGTLTMRAQLENAELRISVSDNGVGMPQNQIERMFELYAQGAPPPDGTDPGLGVGLALVRAIVRLHRGSVHATSRGPGLGSTFEVILPMHSHRSPAAAPAVATATASMTVLLADDNSDAAWALAKLLTREGHKVLVASGGRDALALAETPGLDGAILDIGMPELNGMEVARGIRRCAWGDALWLVALTGWGGTTNRNLILESGFDEHLIKPVDMAVLRQVLAALNKRKAPRGA